VDCGATFAATLSSAPSADHLAEHWRFATGSETFPSAVTGSSPCSAVLKTRHYRAERLSALLFDLAEHHLQQDTNAAFPQGKAQF